MAHPLIPTILDLAAPVAKDLGLEVVGAVFHTNQNPPVLRVDVRNLASDTSLEDCERMSRAFEATLDATDLIPEAYILEISSPGLSHLLTTDRDFVSFRGFPVVVRTAEPFEGHKEWIGNLIRRNDECVYLNRKGRAIAIPRNLVTQVQLNEQQ